MDAIDAINFARENSCTMVDLKFLDFIGSWKHLTFPVQELSQSMFNEGVQVPAFNPPGQAATKQHNIRLFPDPETSAIDPFPQERTLHLLGDILDAAKMVPLSINSRSFAKRADQYLIDSGIADNAEFGINVEYFIFDDVRFDQNKNSSFYFVDSEEGNWNSSREENPNLGYKLTDRGHFSSLPTDKNCDLRTEAAVELLRVGIPVASFRHGAAGGQGEISIKGTSLLLQADNFQWAKYILKNIAHRSGKTLTFMPKPLFGDKGSGLTINQSLWKKGQNLFFDETKNQLSLEGRRYWGGILKHAPALSAFCNPTTNSYKRLASNFLQQKTSINCLTNLCEGEHIPFQWNPYSKTIDCKTPDPACNGYLAFAAILMAGLDGIENRLDVLDSLIDGSHWSAPTSMDFLPNSLDNALNALDSDHEFLLKGDVFSSDAIKIWINHKKKNEAYPSMLRPTPWEFAQYFSC